MKIGHKCTYKKLGITKNSLIETKAKLEEKDQIILDLTRKINLLQQQLEHYINCVNKSQISLLPIIKEEKPTPYYTIIENSNWEKKTKVAATNLFSDYEQWCLEQHNKRINNLLDTFDTLDYQNIYNADVAMKFCINEKKYNRTTIKHRLRLFRRILRKCTKNQELDFSSFLGNDEPPKLKRVITRDEYRNFLNYLDRKDLFVIKFIIELLYKFAIRIGALAKLRVFHITENDFINFPEKNKKIITRKMVPSTAHKIRTMIKTQNLQNNDYIFYPKKHLNDVDKRQSHFSAIINRHIRDSNCFKKTTQEIICSHMFRVTRAVEIGLGVNLQAAKNELNHASENTTYYNYIQPERRHAYINLEEEYENSLSKGQKLLSQKTDRKNKEYSSSNKNPGRKYHLKIFNPMNSKTIMIMNVPILLN